MALRPCLAERQDQSGSWRMSRRVRLRTRSCRLRTVHECTLHFCLLCKELTSKCVAQSAPYACSISISLRAHIVSIIQLPGVMAGQAMSQRPHRHASLGGKLHVAPGEPYLNRFIPHFQNLHLPPSPRRHQHHAIAFACLHQRACHGRDP